MKTNYYKTMKIVYYRESLVGSIIADAVTFGCMLLCMWASVHVNWLWQIVIVTMFVVFMIGKITTKQGGHVVELKSKQEARDWATKEFS